jgi:hypothetical protein
MITIHEDYEPQVGDIIQFVPNAGVPFLVEAVDDDERGCAACTLNGLGCGAINCLTAQVRFRRVLADTRELPDA